MAGGPIHPYSAFPVSANVFPNFHVGDGANSLQTEGYGVAASIAADSIWRVRFEMPPVLPSGTGKLRLVALADAVTGDAKVNVKWASVAMEEAPDTATLNAEGTSTLTWGAGDDDVFKELLVTLDADTLVAGEIVVADITFETSGYNLAVVSTWNFSVIWTN